MPGEVRGERRERGLKVRCREEVVREGGGIAGGPMNEPRPYSYRITSTGHPSAPTNG
jgi:hypothetical protein